MLLDDLVNQITYQKTFTKDRSTESLNHPSMVHIEDSMFRLWINIQYENLRPLLTNICGKYYNLYPFYGDNYAYNNIRTILIDPFRRSFNYHNHQYNPLFDLGGRTK